MKGSTNNHQKFTDDQPDRENSNPFIPRFTPQLFFYFYSILRFIFFIPFGVGVLAFSPLLGVLDGSTIFSIVLFLQNTLKLDGPYPKFF